MKQTGLSELRFDAALIGGTGLGSQISNFPGTAIFVPTEFGVVRGKIVEKFGARVFCIERHSRGHKVAPHRVNYLAIAAAVSRVGAKACFSSAAVGCLNPIWKVGTLVSCSDFLDLTGRNQTRFENAVKHRDFSHAFDPSLNELIHAVAGDLNVSLESGGIYVNMNGPRYETPAEIEMIGRLGGNLVGMTASSEAIAMGEANVPYCCVAVVTNAAAGLEDEALDHTDVVAIMEDKGRVILDLLLRAAGGLSK